MFASARYDHRPMSENAVGYLLNSVGYDGHHVPHGFRAAFWTTMDEWAARHGKDHDHAVMIPAKANRCAPAQHHRATDRWRNRIERLFNGGTCGSSVHPA